MIANINPSVINVAETASTLHYGARANKIQNRPVVEEGAACAPRRRRC